MHGQTRCDVRCDQNRRQSLESEVGRIRQAQHPIEQPHLQILEIVELVQFNVTVFGDAAKPDLLRISERPPASPVDTRRVWFSPEGVVDCPVYDRDDLTPADRILGPAVIEELDSTTIVHPGQCVTISPHGLGVIEWNEAPS